MQDYRIEDQGEWERSRSSRRMFLVLHDTGRGKDLEAIASQLLNSLDWHFPRSNYAEEARGFWKDGLKDPDSTKPNKELADRAYLVIRCSVAAFNAHSRLPDGELAVCTLIRRQVPLAPGGFRRVGKIEGTSSEPSESVRAQPRKLLF